MLHFYFRPKRITKPNAGCNQFKETDFRILFEMNAL